MTVDADGSPAPTVTVTHRAGLTARAPHRNWLIGSGLSHRSHARLEELDEISENPRRDRGTGCGRCNIEHEFLPPDEAQGPAPFLETMR